MGWTWKDLLTEPSSTRESALFATSALEAKLTKYTNDRASNRLGVPPFLAEQLYGFVAFASPVPSTTESSSAISYSYPCSYVSRCPHFRSVRADSRLHLSRNSETVEFSITFADTVHSLTPKEFNITPLASIEGDYCLGAVYGLGLLSVEVEEARHRRGEVLS